MTPLLQALQDPTLYDHPVTGFRVVETHISWVLLTGEYAYKIKKPVDLGFLNFSTLALRHRYCEEELRLNRRLAPELYTALTPITGTPQAPRLGGPGAAIEYAVKMREFPQESQLDRVLHRGGLLPRHLEHLAQHIAAFHDTATVAGPESPYGTAASIWGPVAQNFAQIRPVLRGAEDLALVEQLYQWSARAHHVLTPTFTSRHAQGRVRECHGDMHLANMVLLHDEVIVFDCLEFNEHLRWIDVMSEIAFLTMDLCDRRQPTLAQAFLDSYLQASGDYAGLAVLRYYQVYRALVRAKVACIRATQADENERATSLAQARRYLQLAARCTETIPTPLIITYGLSGSGKTTLTNDLLRTLGAIRLRSDVERKRLFGLHATARSGSGMASGLYAAEASTLTYARLADLAEIAITGGYPVIVDAAFLKRHQRELFRNLAHRLSVPFVVFDIQAPAGLLRQRVAARCATGLDASEADIAVLERQLATRDALQPGEADHVITIAAGTDSP